MLNRRPEIHRQRPDLNFHFYLSASLQRLHLIKHDHMVAAVTTVFHMINVIPLSDHFHIRAPADNLNYFLNILHKLTDDTHSRNIHQLFLNLIHRNIFLLRLVKNTRHRFHAAAHLLNRRVHPTAPMLIDQMFKFYNEFLHCQIIWCQNLTP